MKAIQKKRLLIAILFLCSSSVTLGLVGCAITNGFDLYYTPSQVINGKGDNKAKPQIGQVIQVGGMVVSGSVKRDAELNVIFTITDLEGTELNIIYDGILPDLFREGQGIIAKGILSDPTTLIATEVIAKHDEVYYPPETSQNSL